MILMKLSGNVALITGGTSGIGFATARLLAEHGASVVIGARSADPARISELAEVARGSGSNCVFVPGDVRDPETSGRLVDEALAAFGRIDTVVHSAGGPAPGTTLSLSYADWLDAFDVHVNSAFHLFRAAHKSLAANQGSMTLLSSAAALRGCPGTVAYQTVKAALIQMARALARDHAAEGIRVNCIAPGIIRTPFQSSMTEEARLNNLHNRIPLKREGTPEQVASMILELATNTFITGETMVIDGGMSMRMV
jgi:NAD(P)-dependent dehydrogenase (short-subunit alcohol dehydrogenase family)